MKDDIIDIAKQTIKTEAETLHLLSDSLDHSFNEIIQTLFQCKGRIIITGIGKSALIAQKIVATLNSTGTPSIYMHAGDAAHGDLGMVTKDDVILCLSKSGETNEIKLIIPLIKRIGTKIIAISSERDSFLANNSNHQIIFPDVHEAEPYNLIPTTSTVAQLAIGDAIAISLLSLRDFGLQQYAINHPGGAIGRKIFLKVIDLCVRNSKPRVDMNCPIRETIIEMTSSRLGAVVICDPENNIQGIITDGDLRRMLQNNLEIQTLTAGDLMTKNPITVEKNCLAYEAFQLMHEKNITQIIVEDNGLYHGLIHLHDFMDQGFI